MKFYDLKEGGGFFLRLCQDKQWPEKLGFQCKKDTTGLLLLNAKQIQMQVEYTLWVFKSTWIYNKMVFKIMKLPFPL